MLDLKFNLSLSLTREKESNAMSDWAKKANDKITKDEADKKAGEEFYALQRKQLHAGAPRAWEELKETLFREVTAFGKLRPDYLSMDADYQGSSKITLQSPKGFLDISFDVATPQIDYKVRNKSGTNASSSGYLFEVSAGTVTFSGVNHRNVGAQVVAEELLEKLV